MLEMITAEEENFYTDPFRITIWDEMSIVPKNEHIMERYLPAHHMISVRGSRRVVCVEMVP
jgi:hypothetical protein